MNNRRASIANVLLLAALFLSSCGSTPEEPAALEVAPSIGCLAPDFELKTPEGEVYRLSDLRGKAVFLNFWSTSCRYCKYEMPGIQATHTKYRDEGLVVLGISEGDPAADVVDFRRQLQLTFPLLLDSNEEAAEAYRVMDLPYSFFIDREGVIRSIQIGEMLKADMAVQVVAALAEVPAE